MLGNDTTPSISNVVSLYGGKVKPYLMTSRQQSISPTPTVYRRETYGISFSRIVTIRATSSTLFVCLGFVEVTRVCGKPCDVGSCVRTPTIP